MTNYVLRRLAITPLLLLGIVTIAFIVARGSSPPTRWRRSSASGT